MIYARHWNLFTNHQFLPDLPDLPDISPAVRNAVEAHGNYAAYAAYITQCFQEAVCSPHITWC